MTYTRRTFLRSMGLGAGALAFGSVLGPRRAMAAGEDRNFIFAYFGGAWDTLLGLDPRDPTQFTEARIDQTKIQLAWDQIPQTYGRDLLVPSGSNIEFGPVMGGIANHFDKMCVVRGMSMDTVTHAVGMRYFITGKPPRGLNAAGSSIGTLIASQQGDLLAIPNLVSRVETYNEGGPVFATGLSVNGAPDLLFALRDGAQAPGGAVRTRLDEFRARTTHCDPTLDNKAGLLSTIGETQVKAREIVASGISGLFNFNNQNDADIAALRMRYGITNGNNITAGSQCALAYQALKNGVAQNVTIQVVGGLDTHGDEWATDQPDTQAEGWTALGQLVTDLTNTDAPTGGKLIDKTTIVVFSEFGRTALINNRGGRDHSITNSCMLIGAGVPHNKVVGASSDVGMNPQAVNANTGEVEAGGVTITPPIVLASVMKSAGFDTSELRHDGLPALMA